MDEPSKVSKVSALSHEDLAAYREAVEQHAIVAITDRRGKILYTNDLFCRISGFAREELLGHTHRLVNSGYHSAEFWREVWTTIAAGRIWRGEICNRARDGSIYWVDSTLVPLMGKDGRVRSYMAVRHPITALKRAHDQQSRLERRDAFKESVLNSFSYAVVGTGPDSMINVFNRGAESLLGFKAEELVGIRSIDALCDPDDLRARSRDLLRLRDERSSAAFEREWTYIRKDGSRVPVFLSFTVLRDVGGHFVGYLGVAHDISARKHAEHALLESEQKFRSLYEAAPLAIVRTSFANGLCLEANPAFHAMTGYTPQDLAGLRFHDVSPPVAPEHDGRLQADLRRHGAYGPLERECIRKDGSRFQVLVNGMRSGEPNGRGYVWHISQDISKRKEMELELRRATHIDKLTGLANRSVISEQLAQCIRRTKYFPGYRFTLLYLDLDYFKTINDSLGHGAGDQVLQEIADRLRAALCTTDVVSRAAIPTAARLGGDEFIVLLDDVSTGGAIRVAKKLLRALSVPYQVLGRQFDLSTSIGIVTSECDHPTAEEYLRDADTAMYEAKRAGRRRFAIFDARMRERVQRGLLIQSELRGALHEGQFYLVYQPLVCTETRRIRGCEALLRWRHPRLGLIPPAEFIPIAEDTGVILKLGDWVLRTACAQFARWRERYGERAPDCVNINISRAQLIVGYFDQRVREVLTTYAIEPSRVHLEITETAVMKDPGLALRIMHSLRELGVKLDLDDFGRGYSSLGSIHDFPIDVIKIDRSFIHSMDAGERVPAVIEAVARLARHLNLQVVAEGIETPIQLELVRQLGCQLAQGYLFSEPLEARRFAETFMAAARTRASKRQPWCLASAPSCNLPEIRASATSVYACSSPSNSG